MIYIMFVKIKNKKIYYMDSGCGDKVFLLLHNAGGSHRFFEPQIPILEKLGRVINIDLPGHGESEKITNPTVVFFAEVVVVFCEVLKIKNVSGIGLNYGANIFLEIAKISNVLTSIILIDPPMFISSDIQKLIEENIASLKKQDPIEHARELVSQSFKNPTKTFITLAIEVFENTDIHMLAKLYKELLVWDRKSYSLVKTIHIPMIFVLTDASLCDARSLKKANPSVRVEKLLNSLYWATLDCPNKFNDMLRSFL